MSPTPFNTTDHQHVEHGATVMIFAGAAAMAAALSSSGSAMAAASSSSGSPPPSGYSPGVICLIAFSAIGFIVLCRGAGACLDGNNADKNARRTGQGETQTPLPATEQEDPETHQTADEQHPPPQCSTAVKGLESTQNYSYPFPAGSGSTVQCPAPAYTPRKASAEGVEDAPPAYEARNQSQE